MRLFCLSVSITARDFFLNQLATGLLCLYLKDLSTYKSFNIGKIINFNYLTVITLKFTCLVLQIWRTSKLDNIFRGYHFILFTRGRGARAKQPG